MQQQFKHMNVKFDDKKNWMDKQYLIFNNLRKRLPKRFLMLESKIN
jgi:hypothetical protein